MNVEIEMASRSYLARDEKLLWSGQPRGGIRFRSADIFLVPFSLMWGGFAFFWEYNVVRFGTAAVSFALFGLPFVAMGLHLIVGRFFVDAWQRSRTQYFLTDQRALIVSGLFTRSVKSIPLRTLGDYTLDERTDGSGTITFGALNMPFGLPPTRGWPGSQRYTPPAFEMIENARQVQELIRQQVASTSGRKD